jgi:hypothetical protein
VTRHRLDAAFIQPIIDSLSNWIPLRRRLAACFNEGPKRTARPDGPVWHVYGEPAQLFDQRIGAMRRFWKPMALSSATSEISPVFRFLLAL